MRTQLPEYRIIYRNDKYLLQHRVSFLWFTYYQNLVWGTDDYDAEYDTLQEAEKELDKHIERERKRQENRLKYIENGVVLTKNL